MLLNDSNSPPGISFPTTAAMPALETNDTQEPFENSLDDIFSTSPPRDTHAPAISVPGRQPPLDESHVSDIPRLRSLHATNGYRDGISAGKVQSIQTGFDAGYIVGAKLGLRAGNIIGRLEGVATAQQLRMQNDASDATGQRIDPDKLERDRKTHTDIERSAKALLVEAKAELRVEELCGEKWVSKDGNWKFELEGSDRLTGTDGHPVLKEWEQRLKNLEEELGVRPG